MPKTLTRTLTAMLLGTALLAACGGGGSADDTAPPPAVDTGVVPDSAMASPEALVSYAIAMQASSNENDTPLRMPNRDMPVSETDEAVEID